MTFKQHHRNQVFLLPPSFQDFLGESHEAIVLNEFLQELDTRDLEQSYRNEHGGSSAYHPVMLLAVLVYGYMNGMFSSRKIAKRLSQDLAFMYLAGNTKPDFRTLARFRKEKGIYLETLLTGVVQRARELGSSLSEPVRSTAPRSGQTPQKTRIIAKMSWKRTSVPCSRKRIVSMPKKTRSMEKITKTRMTPD